MVPKKNVQAANLASSYPTQLEDQGSLQVADSTLVWSGKKQRVQLIREGLPITAIEAVGKKGSLSVAHLLKCLDMPQTTYNKRKRENKRLDGRDSELLLVLTEVLDFGLGVFNKERQKFQSWLHKPNTALGGEAPAALFDSITGIEEVRMALQRLEYGNMA